MPARKDMFHERLHIKITRYFQRLVEQYLDMRAIAVDEVPIVLRRGLFGIVHQSVDLSLDSFARHRKILPQFHRTDLA